MPNEPTYRDKYCLGCRLTIQTDGDNTFIVKRGSTNSNVAETEVMELGQPYIYTIGVLTTRVSVAEFDHENNRLVIKTWDRKTAWRSELEIVGSRLIQTDTAADGTIGTLYYDRCSQDTGLEDECDEHMYLLDKE